MLHITLHCMVSLKNTALNCPQKYWKSTDTVTMTTVHYEAVHVMSRKSSRTLRISDNCESDERVRTTTVTCKLHHEQYIIRTPESLNNLHKLHIHVCLMRAARRYKWSYYSTHNCTDSPCLILSAICAGCNDSSSFRVARVWFMAVKCCIAESIQKVSETHECAVCVSWSGEQSKPEPDRPHSCVSVWKLDQDLHNAHCRRKQQTYTKSSVQYNMYRSSHIAQQQY